MCTLSIYMYIIMSLAKQDVNHLQNEFSTKVKIPGTYNNLRISVFIE